MCKKIAITAVAIVAVLVLLNKTSLGSYVGFSWKKGKDFINRQVPPEVEVERLRHELTQLDPEIRKARSTVAEEAVAVEMFREDIRRTQDNLKKRLDVVLSVRQELDSGAKLISFNGKEWLAVRARDWLAREWESYKRSEEALKSKEKLLEVKEVAVNEGHKQLAGMTDLKVQLQAELDLVEAELKTLRLAQTRNNIQLDNTRLTRFNKSLAELKTRIKVEMKIVEYEGNSSVAPPVIDKVDVAEKALKEIDERFGKVAAER